MYIWIKDEKGRWAVLPVTEAQLDLALVPWVEMWGAGENEDRGEGGHPESGKALLMRAEGNGPGTAIWILLAAPDAQVLVNGFPISSGAHALDDRDEIRMAGFGPAYFSTERLARIERLDEATGGVACPRCSRKIAVGSLAVRCPGPGCGFWHHASDTSPCWTYGATCALCPQPSDLEAGFQWTPADL